MGPHRWGCQVPIQLHGLGRQVQCPLQVGCEVHQGAGGPGVEHDIAARFGARATGAADCLAGNARGT